MQILRSPRIRLPHLRKKLFILHFFIHSRRPQRRARTPRPIRAPRRRNSRTPERRLPQRRRPAPTPHKWRPRHRRPDRYLLPLSSHILPPLGLRAQPLLPLLPRLAIIPLLYRRVLECPPFKLVTTVCVEEFFPGLVAAGLHARQLGGLEGVHGDAADEGDVNAKAAVDAGAVEAHEDAEFGGGLP